MRVKPKKLMTFFLIFVLVFQNVIVTNASKDEVDYYPYKGMPNVFVLSSISDVSSSVKTIGNTMYFPAGTFIIKEPIFIDSGSIVGAGMDKTIIIADFENPRLPIVFAGSTPKIKDIQFKFKDGLVTGEENSGERVGLFCANYWALQKGASLSNVKFSNVGTGLYSGGSIPIEALGLPDGVYTGSGTQYDNQPFSVEFDTVVVQDFSYRGVDFRARLRTGNLWKNIYLSSGKYACNSAFWFDGEESECTIDLLTIADTRAEIPISLIGARAMDAGSVTLRNVSLINKNTSYIKWGNSSGYIDQISLNESTIENFQTLIEIGSTNFSNEYNTLNSLHVRRLMLSNVSGMSFVNGFNYFSKNEEDNNPFYVTVDEYYYFADQLEREKYREFPTSEKNIIYTKKGQISEKGSTLLRPKYRLCPYYTKYEDTDLGKTVIWTGSEWK